MYEITPFHGEYLGFIINVSFDLAVTISKYWNDKTIKISPLFSILGPQNSAAKSSHSNSLAFFTSCGTFFLFSLYFPVTFAAFSFNKTSILNQ